MTKKIWKNDTMERKKWSCDLEWGLSNSALPTVWAGAPLWRAVPCLCGMSSSPPAPHPPDTNSDSPPDVRQTQTSLGAAGRPDLHKHRSTLAGSLPTSPPHSPSASVRRPLCAGARDHDEQKFTSCVKRWKGSLGHRRPRDSGHQGRTPAAAPGGGEAQPPSSASPLPGLRWGHG